MQDKQYLGDGVYIGHDQYHIILTTEDGINETNRILLDPSVLYNMNAYIERLRNAQEESSSK